MQNTHDYGSEPLPTPDELIEALESLLTQRADHERCLLRHIDILEEIDGYLNELRDEYGMSGLFEAAEIVDTAWPQEDGDVV